MSYQWGPQGPAFEVRGIYRSENLALLVRAGLLAVIALLVLTLALSELNLPSWMPTKLLQLPQEGRMRHVALGLLLLALAVIDVLRASRQRALRLLPGQPGSLAMPLRSANTESPEAAPLAALLAGGEAGRAAAPGPWPRLARLSPALAAAPLGVQAWMAQRLAHLAWIVGLALILLLAQVLGTPPARAAVAALCVAAAAVVLLRARRPGRAIARPRTLALQLALTLLAALAASLLPAAVGERLVPVGLTQGALLMLVALFVTELLAIAAGLVVADRPPARGPTPAPCTLLVEAGAERVQQEQERELHRYWSEGIPNRRYVWQSREDGPQEDGADFAAAALEESQPLLSTGARAPGHGGVRRPWLLALLALGLAFTLLGAVLWGVVSWQQLQRVAEPWRMGSAAVLFFFAGGYALRVAHLLWSRIEAQSLLLDWQCRAVGASSVQLRWSVTRARSAFYAAAEHVVGSRVLIELASDEVAARGSVQQIKRYAEKISAEAQDGRAASTPVAPPAAPAPPPAPAAHAPRTRAAMRMPAQPVQPVNQATAGPRFCADCGESIPVAARFCPRCGERQRER